MKGLNILITSAIFHLLIAISFFVFYIKKYKKIKEEKKEQELKIQKLTSIILKYEYVESLVLKDSFLDDKILIGKIKKEINEIQVWKNL